MADSTTLTPALGDILHQLDALSKEPVLTRQDAIAQQILASSLEQATMVIARVQKGQSIINKKVIILDLQMQHLDAMFAASVKYSAKNGHCFTLLDDGDTFKILLCNPDSDAAIRVYESESLQPA